MRLWVIFGCLILSACSNDDGEKTVNRNFTETKNITNMPETGNPVDTSVRVVRDSFSHASFNVAEIKKPSGVYRFLFPYNATTKILHTIAFYPNSFRLQEEYRGKKDSIIITEGTWAPSQGFIWLYKDQLARGRYTWKGDTLQYFSPALGKKFSLTKLTPASVNPALQNKKKEGAVLYGVGTEPFWSVEVNKSDSIFLSMPDWIEPLHVKITGSAKENNYTVYTSSPDSLQVTIYPYFCSDGMSDFTYSNKVSVRYKGQTYHGCGVSF